MSDLVVKQSITGTTEQTINFDEQMQSIFIENKGDKNITLTIRGIEIVIEPGEQLNEKYERFTSLKITGTTPIYRGYTRG